MRVVTVETQKYLIERVNENLAAGTKWINTF